MINLNIWEEMYSFEKYSELQMKIFRHKKNFWNNGDKFLIWIRAEQQLFMVGKKINNEDYNLPTLKDEEEINFVVCGNWELDQLIEGFKSIKELKFKDE